MSNSKISALTSATTPLAGTEVLPVVQSSTTKQVSVANLTAGRAVTMLSGQVGTKTTSSSSDISSTFSAGLASASAGTAVAATLCNTVAAAVGNETQLTFSPASNYSATGAIGVVIESIATANSALKFYTYNAGLLEAARIDSGGNYIPKNAAKGVNFTANTPAAGMTSQLLNWYEEGTWTPNFSTWTTAPTLIGARYVRVGKQVTLTIICQSGTALGGSTITGLPFTSNSAQGAVGVFSSLSTPPITSTGLISNSSSSISYIAAVNYTTAGNYWCMSITYSA